MKDPKSDVYLARAEQVNTILGCTLFGKSVGGMELTQFIRSLQTVLLEKYDWAREQKMRSIQQLFAAVRTSIKHGRISDDQLMMLDNFGLAGDDAFSAKLLRAEDLYRSCNFESYDSFVNALPYEEQRKIKVKQEEFSKDLRRDLSDPKGTFDSEYLTSAHQNLSGAKRSAPSEKAIFCYLCIRLDRNVEYRLEKESIARCDRDGAQEVEDFLLSELPHERGIPCCSTREKAESCMVRLARRPWPYDPALCNPAEKGRACRGSAGQARMVFTDVYD